MGMTGLASAWAMTRRRPIWRIWTWRSWRLPGRWSEWGLFEGYGTWHDREIFIKTQGLTSIFPDSTVSLHQICYRISIGNDRGFDCLGFQRARTSRDCPMAIVRNKWPKTRWNLVCRRRKFVDYGVKLSWKLCCWFAWNARTRIYKVKPITSIDCLLEEEIFLSSRMIYFRFWLDIFHCTMSYGI